MKCINLKQKLDRTLYCKKKNKLIKISDCKNCKYKEYEPTKEKKIIKKVNKRTKALAITKKVKIIVWNRDNHKCIFCHCEVPWNLANSHFIKRSHGGLGIEENIFCACLVCHKDFDDSPKRKNMLLIAEEHLKSKYENWNISNLVYKK